MKKAFAAGLVLAGIMAISGTAFAGPFHDMRVVVRRTPTAEEARPEPPREYVRPHRPISRDHRHELPDRRHPDIRRVQPQQGVESRW